jgi:hypothetical protein
MEGNGDAVEGKGDAASDGIVDTIEIYEISDCDNLCETH